MSERVFIDTNLLIRLFSDDNPAQTTAVLDLLQQAGSGELTLVANVAVIAEVVWVLESVYQLGKEAIREHIWSILNTLGVEVENSTLVSQAADTFATQNIDFVDAYNAAWMQTQDIHVIYTFDQRHFRRVTGIDVKVPGS